MTDQYSTAFQKALKNNDLEAIRRIPKADLHNHFVLGGSRKYLYEKTNTNILPTTQRLKSMQEMNAWSSKYIGQRFDGATGRRLLIEAAFIQAKADNVTVLEIGEDVWGLKQFFHNDIVELIETFEEIHERIAPDIELRLQIGLSRHCSIDYLLDCLKQFWGHNEFYSIDLYGDELAQPIENFILIYQMAKENGLRRKAHIGEWGTAEDVVKGVEVLHLNEVQHGIAAVNSKEAMEYIKEHGIRLNITPTSNVILSRTENMASHPIGELYRNGIDVTINSDDILIFDSEVSKEYLRLYQAGCLTTEELDAIRVNGLKRI